MAQTRATGKAFRMSIGWIMKLAGYEPTPSEEVSKEVIEATEAANAVGSVEETTPIQDVELVVESQLKQMSATDKIKFLKDYAGTVSDKKLTEPQYRRMYGELLSRRKATAESEPA